MAAIDGLLRLMLMRNAEALVIASGEIPSLRRSGQPAPLSMPPLASELVEAFLQEVSSEADQEALAAGKSREISYQLDSGERFEAVLENKSGTVRMTFRPAGTARPASGRAPLQVVAEPQSPAPPPLAEGEVGQALAEVEHRGGSDLLLSAGRPARIRVDGRWLELDHVVPTDDDILAAVAAGLDDRLREALQTTGSADFALDRRSCGGLRFRVNLFRQSRGLSAALRPIRDRVPSLAELGLPDSLHRLTAYASGLVLMTGRAGSGKSTTLVALVEQINRSPELGGRHIITIEDPVEYEYPPGRALIHQREVGRDTDSFASGLRAALREAPDVILVGEMRDLETIAAALTAAETGHLVLATLHAGDSASAIDRIIDVFPAHQQRQVRTQLSTTLRAVITQVLLPARTGGRVPAYETMMVTAAVANQIREDKVHQIESQIWTSKSAGMVPLERTLARLVREGQIDRQTARSACNEPERLDDLLRS